MQYDIAIVGAGLVGASLAVALRDYGLKIALIDGVPSNPSDKRLFALNISSVQFLSNIGVWQLIEKHASSIKRVHVSKRKRFGVVQLNCADVDLSALGYVMPARHLEGALTALLPSISLLDCYRPMQLVAMSTSQNDVALQLSHGELTQEIRAQYVIGADGTASTVRKLMQWEVIEEEYAETAIVCEITVNCDHEQVAYERFYHDGVLAMLPLRERTMAVILSASQAEAKRLLQLSDADFLSHVQLLFGNRLGKLQAVSSRASYPLRFMLAKKASEKRILLLGNAAHTVHPVAAQGFNLALYEVAKFIEAIKETKTVNASLLQLDFTTIQSQFSTQQALSINVSRRLFSAMQSPSLLTDLLMQTGMLAFESLPFVKRQFLNAMLGRLGQVPKLMLTD